MTTAYFAAGAVVMGFGTAFFAYMFATDARNRTYHALLTAIGAIAFAAYVLMSLEVATIAVDGRAVDLPRYGQWILATPLIVVYLGLLAGLSRRLLVTLVVLDLVVMLAGLAGALTTGLASWAAFAFGCVAYLPLIYGLTARIGKAVRARPSPVRALFEKLRNLTLIIWTFYPVVWALGPTGIGVIGGDIEVIVITYADFIAKIGFGVIALNGQRALSTLPRLDALRFGGSDSG